MATLDREERLKRLSPEQRALLLEALRREAVAGGASRVIPRRQAAAPAPLSFPQQRVWLLDRLAPGSPAYNLPFALELAGRLAAPALEQALAEVVRRHEVLRSVFAAGADGPVQRPSAAHRRRLPRVDLAGLPEERRRGEALCLARGEAGRPFDLERGPVLRAFLLRLAGERHVFLTNVHHIATDGASNDVLAREVAALYAAFTGGDPPSLPEPSIQYADYAAWQRQRLSGEASGPLLSYWQERLAGAPPVLELPTDHPRPSARTLRAAAVARALPAGLGRRLQGFAQERGATPFMTLLAAFFALLGRWTGGEDLVVGSPVANREGSETEDLIGFFANTLVLRGDLGGEPTFGELCERVRETALGAFEHAELPFERLVEALRPDRQASVNPLFQVAFVVRDAAREAFELPGVRVLPLDPAAVHSGHAKFDLTLFVELGDGGPRAWVELSRELFDPTTAARLLRSFETLLGAALARPATPVAALPLLAPAERQQLLLEWQTAAGSPGAEATVHGLVEAWAATTPDAVAVSADGLELTYGELVRGADRLAARLRRRGVGRGTPVGVALDRSPDLVVALLAILKSGGAYVPLDPSYPAARLEAMVADSGVALVLTAGSGGFPVDGGPSTVALDRLRQEPAAGPEGGPPPAVSPDDLAYVTFTSGSTGRPKGVAVPHRAVVRLVRDASYARLTPEVVLLELAPVSFDASTFEIWGALANGGRLVVAPPGAAGLSEIGEALERSGATTLWLTAGLFHQVVAGRPAALAGVRQLLAGGDVLSPPHVRRLLEASPGTTLINGYGPTENTTFTCCHRLEEASSVTSPVPIGRPIAGTLVRVLDRRMRPLPAGSHGELYAGGDGLAHGYLGRPARTAERFVPDPWGDPPGSRLYRTGDLVRHRGDGVLEFLGRADQQVKVRGFRVELEEIEAVLSDHPEVGRAAVAAPPDAHGSRRLVAYVVPAEAGAGLPTGLREHLAARLPAFMIPSLWVSLPELPLGPNGKVDRRALPEPEIGVTGEEEGSRPPATALEELLAGIWAEALGVPSVGRDDDFFHLGGHSLLAARIAARIEEVAGVRLPLGTLFDLPTVSALAAEVEALRQEASEGPPAPPLVPVRRRALMPLSYAQERLWILDRFEPGSPAYDISASVLLGGKLDRDALAAAVTRLAERHESLRTTFVSVEGEPRQRIAPEAAVSLEVEDLTGLAAEERRAALEEHSREVSATSFDLAAGPLLRLRLLRLGEREHALLLATHHIVSDGWSMGVLIRELAALYGALAAGREPQLPELPVGYADFAVWQRQQEERLERQAGYWRRRLAGAPSGLEIPTDRPRPAVRSYRGGGRRLVLEAPLAEGLRKLARERGATLFMVLLAAFGVLLQRLSGQDDILVGSPIAGRGRPELDGVIGIFLNTLVLRLDLSGDPAFSAFLERVRQAALEAYTHQDVPFEKLLDELKPERDLSRTPLFQVFFNMLNLPPARVELPGLTVEPLAPPEVPAKFDLTVYAAEEGERLAFELVYNTQLFDGERIAEMLRQYRWLLAQVVADPERPVGTLSLVTPQASALLPDPRAALGDRWLGPVHEIFAAEAARTPDRIAVADTDELWSYGELDARADRLARYLERGGVGRGDVVAIYAARSARLAWAVLGVLKAGAAFLLLDPAYPPERLVSLLRLARPRGWIELAAAGPPPAPVAELVAGLRGCPRIVLPLPGGEDPLPRDLPAGRPEVRVGADDLAYIAFTSGSTGTPKGILGRHGPLSHFIPWQRRQLGLSPGDRFSLLSGLAHDPLQRDLFTPLQMGATVVAPPPEAVATPGELAAWLGREAITVVHLTPALGQVITEPAAGSAAARLPALARAFFVGDVLTRRDVERLRELAPDVACVNFYGSTETQRAVGWHPVTATDAAAGLPAAAGTDEERQVLPLGRGMEDVQLLVLGRGGGLAGVGEVGEIHVRSPHLAAGYLGDPQGTAQRFVANPSSATPSDRVYRTGDLGRYRPDGTVEFAGRADDQVKIRGFRIEPGEIQAHLARHPAVRESVVVARRGAAGGKRLVAYVVPQGGAAAAAELRDFLRGRLPDYMVPEAFVSLERLPLTPNGKLDRRALPEPRGEERPAGGDFVAPATEAERRIAAVLREVLGIEEVGLHDNFFELGSNSLALVRVHARLRQVFDREIQVVELFTHPTVAALAGWMSREEGAGGSTAPQPGGDRSEELREGRDRRQRRFERMKRRIGSR